MSNKKDIGNLNNKEFGVHLDPKDDMCLAEDSDKGQQAYYKGTKMEYLDYIGERGVGADNVGMFSGFGKGTLKKPYKEIN